MLGGTFRVTTSWQSGYRAAVSLDRWLPGVDVHVSIPSVVGTAPRLIEILSTYGATVPTRGGADGSSDASELGVATRFILSDAPDPAYGGFGFTARGVAPPEEAVEIR